MDMRAIRHDRERSLDKDDRTVLHNKPGASGHDHGRYMDCNIGDRTFEPFSKSLSAIQSECRDNRVLTRWQLGHLGP